MSVGFREGVQAQPANLRAGASLAREALAAIDLGPLRAGSIVFSGIGASWHALLPTVGALRAAGRRAFAVPATELARARELGDAYVLVSQSGASTELLTALDTLGDAPVYAVSARGDGPLAAGTRRWLPLGPHEDSDVSTLAYTATLQTLGLLCEAILDAREDIWPALPELVQEAIDEHDDGAAEFAERLDAIVTIDAVGGSSAVASAGEMALLAREALRLPGTGEATRQYLHGPIEAVDEGFGCFLFGAARELELAAALASYGARVCAVSELPIAVAGVHGFRIPAAPETAAPILQIVPAQLVVAHAGARRGLKLDALRREQLDTKVERA